MLLRAVGATVAAGVLGMPWCARNSSRVSASCLTSAGPASRALGDRLKCVALEVLRVEVPESE